MTCHDIPCGSHRCPKSAEMFPCQVLHSLFLTLLDPHHPTRQNKTMQIYPYHPVLPKGVIKDNVDISHIQLSYSKMLAGWWWLEPWNLDWRLSRNSFGNHPNWRVVHHFSEGWPHGHPWRGNGIAKWPLPFFVLRSQATWQKSNDSHERWLFPWVFFRKTYWNTMELVEFPNLKWWNPQCPSVWILVSSCFDWMMLSCTPFGVQKAEAILIQHGKPRHGFFSGWFHWWSFHANGQARWSPPWSTEKKRRGTLHRKATS